MKAFNENAYQEAQDAIRAERDRRDEPRLHRRGGPPRQGRRLVLRPRPHVDGIRLCQAARCARAAKPGSAAHEANDLIRGLAPVEPYCTVRLYP